MLSKNIYKSSKALLLVAVMTFVSVFGSLAVSADTEDTGLQLATPKVSSLSLKDGSIHVSIGDNGESHKGVSYETQYRVKGKTAWKDAYGSGLKVVADGLTVNKTYEFRVRAVCQDQGQEVSSAWSPIKTKKSNAKNIYYTKAKVTKLYKGKSNKKAFLCNSKNFVKVGYMTQLVKKGTVKYKGATLVKVTYKGKTRYIRAKNALTQKAPLYNYRFDTNSPMQQAVIDSALEILRTKNVYGNSTSGPEDWNKMRKNKSYKLVCSSFVAAAFTFAYQDEYPFFYFKNNLEQQYNIKTLFNKGYKSEVAAKVVCKGKVNVSKLKPGDILFFDEKTKGKGKATHVAIYLGNKEIIHSTQGGELKSKGGVNITALEGMYKTNFLKAVRVLPEEINPIDKTVTTNGYHVYKDLKCNTKAVVTDTRKGDELTLLYTIDMYTYNKIGYVRTADGKYGYVQMSSLHWSKL